MNNAEQFSEDALAGNLKDLKDYIGVFWASDLEPDVIKRLTLQLSEGNNSIVMRGIKAAKSILNARKYENELVSMVLWEVNEPIEDPLIDSARNWLQSKIDWTEQILERRIE